MGRLWLFVYALGDLQFELGGLSLGDLGVALFADGAGGVRVWECEDLIGAWRCIGLVFRCAGLALVGTRPAFALHDLELEGAIILV